MTFSLLREETLDGDQLRARLAKSPVRAAQAILSAAKAHFVDAQALLGQILLDGNGIERDPKLARIWFQIAANNGHTLAQNMLGRCHEHGWGCVANPLKAAAHYQIAANAGLDWGLYNFANLLATGRGITQDPIRALSCYRKAAEMGHAKSMNLLGRYLEEGQFCEADAQAAVDWYRRSAEGGDFRGQFSYAGVLANQGRIEEALYWFNSALAGGNLNFLRVSGEALLQAEHPTLRALASDYYQRAAALGDKSDTLEHNA